jgi:hypothetical protein
MLLAGVNLWLAGGKGSKTALGRIIAVYHGMFCRPISRRREVGVFVSVVSGVPGALLGDFLLRVHFPAAVEARSTIAGKEARDARNGTPASTSGSMVPRDQ